MIDCTQFLFGWAIKKVEAPFDSQPLSLDSGMLPIRSCDEKLKLIERASCILEDPRDPSRVKHSMQTLMRQRVRGICAGYEDCDDESIIRSTVTGLLRKLMTTLQELSWCILLTKPKKRWDQLVRASFELVQSQGIERTTIPFPHSLPATLSKNSQLWNCTVKAMSEKTAVIEFFEMSEDDTSIVFGLEFLNMRDHEPFNVKFKKRAGSNSVFEFCDLQKNNVSSSIM